MYKIAHISDLHISRITYGLSQFFSKRWIGNINLILKRKKAFKEEILKGLYKIFEKEDIDYIIVSGDLSSTSFKKEFEEGKKLFEFLSSKNIKPLFVPGNHDHYTKRAFKKKLFYNYFENPKEKTNEIENKFSLKTDKVEAVKLKNNWWYIGLDTTYSTHFLSSKGLFFKDQEKKLKELLNTISPSENIILVNHFPFLNITSKRKKLKRADSLKNLIKKYKNIKLFLHGHTHVQNILDLRKEQMPLILSSGAVSHRNLAKWNLIEIEENRCKISIFHWKNKWEKEDLQKTFSL